MRMRDGPLSFARQWRVISRISVYWPVQFYDIHTHHNTDASDVTSIRNVRLGHDRFVINGASSVGVHPADADPVSLEALFDAVRTRGVIAVGETGLDRAIDVPFDVQRAVFLRHIDVSEAVSLPLIIHCVRAYDDIIALRRVLQPTMPWIIHGFNKGGDIVERLVRADLYVSFGGALLRRDAPARTAILQVPMERCMLETDDDAELRIGDVYAVAAELRELTIESLCTTQQANFEAVFRQ